MERTGRAIPFRDGLLALLMALFFLAIALPGLSRPPFVVFDEYYHVRSALDLAAGQKPSDTSHPPFARNVMAASMLATGTAVSPAGRAWIIETPVPETFPAATALAWRLPSLMAGMAAVAFTFLLARCIGLAWPFALLAAGLLALDGCFFVHARIGMTNIFEVAFVLAAALGAARAVGAGHPLGLWAAGAALGLSIASRSTGVAALALIGAWAAWRLRSSPRLLVHLVVAFSVVPVLIYAASYAPLVAVGPAPGAADLLDWASWRATFVDAQGSMVRSHTVEMKHLRHAYESPWWSWPFMARPALYTIQYGDGGAVHMIWAIGNAVVWWASVPALLAAALAAWRGRVALVLPALLGLGMWAVWIVVPQPMAFMHYFLTVIPFACVAIAALLAAWWDGQALIPGASPLLEPAAGRAATGLVAVAAAAWFLYYQPLLSWRGVSPEAVQARQWFGAAWR